MNSELDRIFEQGLSDLTRTPKTPLSDEQIATAAKASRIGVVLWLRMHVKEILLCAISLVVGIGCTLLVLHFTGVQRVAPEPAETVAAVVCDTAMVADDAAALSDGPATTVVETQCIASLQIDQPVATSAKPNAKPAVTAVETRHVTSLQPQRPSVQAQAANPQTDAPDVVRPTSDVSQPEPVVIKRTIVQRDTVRVRESVIVKDTVFVE